MSRQHVSPLDVADALERAHVDDHPDADPRHVELVAFLRRILRLGSPRFGVWPLTPTWAQRWRCARFVGHCWHVYSAMGLDWVCCVCCADREHPGPPHNCTVCGWLQWSAPPSTAES